jgi:zinc transport system substrate-binding protein
MAKCGQKQTSQPKKKAVRRLIASHPVYQYFTRRYSLNLKSILWEPDALPAESEWQNLAERRERHPASWMLWKAEPVAESRERLQQLGVQSAVFDPCAKPAGSG